MQKILRTVYRQLYKKAVRVDRDIAMRSMLSCAPRQVYDQHRGEWVAVDVARQAAWPESRVFLDNLIRRLNGGREFFLPDLPINGAANSGNRCLPLVATLREAFVNTPFTVGQMNNAFAALREIVYVTEPPARNGPPFIGPPPAAAVCPVPSFRVAPAVEEMDHELVSTGSFLAKSPPPDCAAEDPENEAPQCAMTVDAIKRAAQRYRNLPFNVVGKDERNDGVKLVFQVQRRVPLRSAQILVAHPQMNNCYRHAIVILVRVVPGKALALMLNKPLESEGILMAMGEALPLDQVHPIFSKYLSRHTLMIGGPFHPTEIGTGASLIHRIVGVENAVPLTGGLWLDGDFDAIERRLDEGTADPRDIFVVRGFCRWGQNQLDGEVRSGAWIAASCPVEDPALDEFLCTLTRHAGEQGPTHVAPGTPSGEGVNHRTTAVWAWFLRALGKPYEDLAQNQRPPREDNDNNDNDEEEEGEEEEDS